MSGLLGDWIRKVSKEGDSKVKPFVVVSGLALILVYLPVPSWAQDAKLARASDEKKVVVYNTTTVPDMQKIIEGFRKKYPFLEKEFDDIFGVNSDEK